MNIYSVGIAAILLITFIVLLIFFWFEKETMKYPPLKMIYILSGVMFTEIILITLGMVYLYFKGFEF